MLAANSSVQVAQAELTRDMIEALMRDFDAYANAEGIVTVELRDGALWVAASNLGERAFLGLASTPDCLRPLE